MHLPDPTFPPLFTGHPVKAPDRPFKRACRGAEAGAFGAGDFLWAKRADRVDCAIVLEPEVSGARLYEMLFTAMVAFGDAVGAIAPPEVAVTYLWPQTIRVNGAAAGTVRIAWSARGDEAGAPIWLVVGLDCWIRRTHDARDPGLNLDETDLFEEGCGELDRTQIIESFARHFLSWIDTWDADGFAAIHRDWLGRADRHKEHIALDYAGKPVEGLFLGLDDAGNMLLKTGDGVAQLRVAEALAPEEVLLADVDGAMQTS